jgi:transposase-like protein
LDEACIKVNGLVGFMLDVNRNEIMSMRVYPSRNALEQLIREVLNYCDGKPKF